MLSASTVIGLVQNTLNFWLVSLSLGGKMTKTKKKKTKKKKKKTIETVTNGFIHCLTLK